LFLLRTQCQNSISSGPVGGSQQQACLGDSAACQRDEQGARSKLEENWSQYSAAERTKCHGLVATGGAASFVELLTCLEMAKQVKELPKAFD